jgi:ADP-heptose:LPS heptosyltransferase
LVDLGFLGDTLHTLPALVELHRSIPGLAIDVLTTPVGSEMLKMAPYVTRAIPFPLSAPSPPWWRHWDILSSIRARRYDVAMSFNGSDRNIFITAFSGAGLKILHDDSRPHFWRTWLVPHWVARRSRSIPVFEQRRQILAALGFNLEAAAFNLRVNSGEQQWAEAQLPADALHFSINASSHIKEWPLVNWIAFAKQCLQDLPGRRIVATGGMAGREQARLAEFVGALSTEERSRIILFDLPLSIPRLAAVLQRCQVHVGADSGVLHLAMALGVPTLSVFRDYEGLREWLPVGPKHRSIVRHCPCEANKVWERRCGQVAQCLAAISAGELHDELRLLLSSVEANPVGRSSRIGLDGRSESG